MTNDQWPMTNDQWPMTNHQWPITNDQWPITNDQSPMTNHQWPITNDQSPMTNHQWPITNDQSPMTNDQWPMTKKTVEKANLLYRQMGVMNQVDYSAPWGKSSRCSPGSPGMTFTLPSSSTSTIALSPSCRRVARISSANTSSNKRIIARRRGLAP